MQRRWVFGLGWLVACSAADSPAALDAAAAGAGVNDASTASAADAASGAGGMQTGIGGTSGAGAGNPAGGADAGSAIEAGGGDGGDAGTARYPADLLDLGAWKITLPIAEDDQSTDPLEIVQPELATYALDPYFALNDAGDGVMFRAHAGGATTENSGYPRSELREMTEDGSDEAGWSTTEGTHTLILTQAITHLPVEKPHVVAGQVHDDSDDVIMIRLEDRYLFVEGGGEDLGELDPDYTLGTRFTVKIVAGNGHIAVFYEDLSAARVDVEVDATGCYFKAGAYTQSNPEQGDDPEAYGEVVIYDLQLIHE